MTAENVANNRVIGYIDGFNLYHGLNDKGWKQFYWFDPNLLVEQLISGDRELSSTKYFTAPTRHKTDGSHTRQQTYLDMLEHVSNTQIYRGRFYLKPVECKQCNSKWMRPEEKMTDTAIATHLVADAFLNAFDTALLIGGDTDIIPAIRMVKKHFPKKRIEVWFPPARTNQHVAKVADDSGTINGEHLRKSQMQVSHTTANGIVLSRPLSWSNKPVNLSL